MLQIYLVHFFVYTLRLVKLITKAVSIVKILYYVGKIDFIIFKKNTNIYYDIILHLRDQLTNIHTFVWLLKAVK